ncbi:S-DNA-T family DNA segregation ATPase FtsK/SpoIIIE [Bacillus tianshenii]|uniref:S-DNA-T family DNA segregation ATPase FtsK/SpoIIIE n=1 Tax=Sutcliffiella tianshenii TaxID=1463404 RepID=A0ABS2P327_9BACI|nr:S-DNA-T family DNA segregation ATPase FtsK/SpoIIIE [Bacillus tianshenii]
MNWFKKLFAQLNDDVEQERIEQSYAKKPEQKTEQKNIQARISYQYPNGKFRFPLIPDGEKDVTEPPPQMAAKKKKETVASQAREIPEPIIKEQTKKEVPTAKKVTPKKVEPNWKEKKPFHPTEVVSPVYGYSLRPPARKKVEVEEVIPEIELESLSFAAQNDEEVTLDPIQEEASVDQEDSYNITETAQEKVQAFSFGLLKEENHYNRQIEEEETPKSEIFKSNAEVEVDHYRKEQEMPIETTPEVRDNFEIEEEEVSQPVEEYPPVLVEQTESFTPIEEKSSNEMELPQEKPKTQSLQKEASAIKPRRESENNRNKEYKRQHIPYNVLMLKQDKRTLEKRKTEEVQLEYYRKPPIHLLNIPPQHSEDDREWVEDQRRLLDETLHHFRVGAKVVKATQGPSVTQFEVQPEPGVKVNKITNLSDDIKLSLSARDIRMEAPIPGKNTIGIEVPNRVSKPVLIREIIRHPSFIQNASPLTVAMGLDISGQPVVLDLQKMPHGLIAGATGSGKSVCVNSIIMSLLYKSTPDEVKLLLIDPKMVELTPYNHIPHLVSPVITDVKAATAALKWAVEEMERRYSLFVHAGVRDIAKYNEGAKKHKQETLPYMVIIIDELADLMMVAPSDVEEAICRIAQKARACGMHLLIATQRPSVDVITGLIKANIPTRIAFSVSSQVDSRTIIDIGGAERLLGRGDMLLLENGAPKPIRVQGNFVSDEEIEKAVSHVRKEQKPTYLFEQTELLKESYVQEDELFLEACQFVVDQNVASTSSLQRRFRIGYNRAARLMELMEDQGVISGPKGSKPRDVLVSEEELITRHEAE